MEAMIQLDTELLRDATSIFAQEDVNKQHVASNLWIGCWFKSMID